MQDDKNVRPGPWTAGLLALLRGGGSGSAPPPPPSGGAGDDEEEGMLRMSFMEHLEELRSRILKALAGVCIVAVCCLYFANDLWRIVSEPATYALKHLGYP